MFTSFVNKFFFVKERKMKMKRKLKLIGGEGNEISKLKTIEKSFWNQ